MGTAENVLLSCRIPPKLFRLINAYAKAHGLNRTSAVIVLLNQGLENSRLAGRSLQLAIEDMEDPGETPPP